jgi:PBP1b-binding outer membrane lipoprotein LpoB
MRYFLWLVLASALLAAGCKQTTAPPTPLAADQIPTEMQKAFAQAKPDPKRMVDEMLKALQAKDYAAAYQVGQAISATPDITKDQLLVTARALLTINGQLKEASAQGDQSAAAFINYQKHNR